MKINRSSNLLTENTKMKLRVSLKKIRVSPTLGVRQIRNTDVVDCFVYLEIWRSVWRFLPQPFGKGSTFLLLKLNVDSTVLPPLMLPPTSSLWEVSLCLSSILLLLLCHSSFVYWLWDRFRVVMVSGPQVPQRGFLFLRGRHWRYIFLFHVFDVMSLSSIFQVLLQKNWDKCLSKKRDSCNISNLILCLIRCHYIIKLLNCALPCLFA